MRSYLLLLLLLLQADLLSHLITDTNSAKVFATERERQGGDTFAEAPQVFPWETVEGTTSGYNDDYHEVCPYDTPGSPDVVYLLVMYHSAIITMDLCESGYDTKIYVYNADTMGLVGCNDDFCNDSQGNPWRSLLEVDLSPGEFYIVIDGYGGSAGNYILVLTDPTPRPGDVCETAIPVDDFPFYDERDTRSYSNTMLDPSPDVYYQLLIIDDTRLRFTTCEEELFEDHFNTTLNILAEDCATLLWSNDDDCSNTSSGWSTLELCLAQGNYYLLLEGAGDAMGNFHLNLTELGECSPCELVECPPSGNLEEEPNDGPHSLPPAYTTIAPGEIWCGTATCQSEGIRDTDWYQFELFTAADILFDLDGEENHHLQLQLVSEAGGEPEVMATALPLNACNDLQLFTTAEAGTYVAVVAYDSSYSGNAQCDYTLTWVDLAAVGTGVTTLTGLQLAQNYPNPFNPTTTIDYQLPRPEQVELAVFNVKGELVRLLARGLQTAGIHQVNFNAGGLASGVYVYRLTAGEFVISRKMMLLR